MSASKEWGCSSIRLTPWKTLDSTSPYPFLFHSYQNNKFLFRIWNELQRKKIQLEPEPDPMLMAVSCCHVLPSLAANTSSLHTPVKKPVPKCFPKNEFEKPQHLNSTCKGQSGVWQNQCLLPAENASSPPSS